jgi:D-3-phosphoglycerate dehydrogenase
MKKVVIATKLDSAARDILLENGGYEVVQDESGDLASIAAKHADTYALIVRSEKVTAEVIDALGSLRVIIRAGAGFNTIDTKHARRKSVDVMNTPGANANAVAEEVLALILADCRHIIAADASTRAGKWEKKKFTGRELAEKTVGIVGLGNVGRLVARRLSGFDVTLLGYDPVISSERARDMDVKLCDLETLFSRADFITLHIPENDETRGIVNAKLLSLVQPGTAIVNCARAGIVNEADLRQAKTEKDLRYLNDVYPQDVEGEKPIADVADIMLPHLGASTREANHNAARRAAEQLVDFELKGVTSFIVNRDIPEGLDETYCDLTHTVARLCRSLAGKENALKLIETSFYGTLEEFADWLIVPIVAALWSDFDRSMDFGAAQKYLEDMGIDYVNRPADSNKGYGTSITIDLTCAVDEDTLRRTSIRGTVAEGTMVISRINRFNKLYFEPTGNALFFIYDDRPGVIGIIGGRLAEEGVNIEEMRNTLDSDSGRSLVIMKVDQPVSDEIARKIGTEVGAFAAFSIKL